jgi:hypothetical protein
MEPFISFYEWTKNIRHFLERVLTEGGLKTDFIMFIFCKVVPKSTTFCVK